MAEVLHPPCYWDLLSLPDQQAYIHLQRQLSTANYCASRKTSLPDLDNIFEAIKTYTNRGNDEDWKRSIACGIYFINDCIAVNPKQLSILTDSSKSSINNQLERLKYVSIPLTSEDGKKVFSQIPKLSAKSHESQWTVRKKSIMTPQPTVFDYKSYSSLPFNTPQPSNGVQSQNFPENVDDGLDTFYDDPLMVPIKGWEESAQLASSIPKANSFYDIC